jgi:benzoyl-CoA reductase/2-hydroxyglutaryl-CoA dehydratase subunit BcrC/BadD/HgdB
MKRIIYSCPYVPAEWIAAHGLRPSRIMPDAASSATVLVRREGVCPYARAFVGEAVTYEQAGAVVVTTVCDQMRRASDILVRQSKLPAFLMNVPSTWQTVASQRLYVDELKRLGRFLVRLGGKSPSQNKLTKVMLEYDAARASILAARGSISARQYAEAIAAFGRDGPDGIADYLGGSAPLNSGVPLAVVGGPLMRSDLDLYDMVEQGGGRIVLDATETGERGMCGPFDRRRLHEDPLAELANAYFGGIQDASRRPNSELYRWLACELAARDVRGIIFRRYVWCDMWHAELQRLKEWVDLPVLDIDVAGDTEAERQRWRNRIRAFLETVK